MFKLILRIVLVVTVIMILSYQWCHGSANKGSLNINLTATRASRKLSSLSRGPTGSNHKINGTKRTPAVGPGRFYNSSVFKDAVDQTVMNRTDFFHEAKTQIDKDHRSISDQVSVSYTGNGKDEIGFGDDTEKCEKLEPLHREQVNDSSDKSTTNHSSKKDMFPSILNFGENETKNYKDLEAQDIDKKLTFTCLGMCGSRTLDNYPCSCHFSCVLYKTCCENMEQHCPQTLQTGREDFHLLLGSTLVCGEEGIFKISSCPQKRDPFLESVASTGEEGMTLAPPHSENYAAAAVDSSYTKGEKTRMKLSISEIERAVLNAPVTESNYGLTFLNKSIYDCYSESNLLGDPLFWGLRLNSKKEFSPLSLDDLGDAQSHSYYPIFTALDILKPTVCGGIHVISSCVKGAFFNQDDAENCGRFVGFLLSKKSFEIYRNRFCAYCHEGRHQEYKRQDFTFRPGRGYSTRFSVIVSLKNSKFHVDRDIQRTLSIPQTWTEATCPMLTVTENDARNSTLKASGDLGGIEVCTVSCNAKAGFRLHSDGRCKAKNHVKIAFQADETIRRAIMTCRSGLQSLANFVSCGLSHIFSPSSWPFAEFLPTESDVYVAYDARINKTLLVLEMTAESSEPGSFSSFAYSLYNKMSNIYKAAIIIAAFKEYARTEEFCEPSEEKFVNNTYIYKEIYSTPLQIDPPASTEYIDIMESLRGRVLKNESTTSFCVTYFYLSQTIEQAREPTFQCIDDAVHEMDAQSVKEVLNYSCINSYSGQHVPSEVTLVDNRGSQSMGINNFVQLIYFAVLILVGFIRLY